MNLGAAALFLATLRDQAPSADQAPAAGSAALPGAERLRVDDNTGGPHPPVVGECRGEAPVHSLKGDSHQPVFGESAVASAVATVAEPSRPLLQRTKPQSRGWKLSDPFIYLGRISYGLYVFHVLGLMISDFAVPHQGASLGRFLFRDTVGFAITVTLSAISFRWLETPFLNLKQRFTHVLSRPGG